MSEVYSTQMDNAEMAFVAATRALRELPDEAKNLALCSLLYKAADARDEMMDAAERGRAPGLTTRRVRSSTARWRSCRPPTTKLEEAVESWKQVMSLAPTDGEAMEQIGKLLATQGRVPELIDVLKRQLNIEEDTTRRVGLLFQMGVLQDEQLNDAGAALTTFRRLLELAPTDANALARMDGLCEDQQRWPELADVLGRRAAIVSAEERPAILFKLGVVRETRLLDKSGAIELYAELLAQNARHPGAAAARGDGPEGAAEPGRLRGAARRRTGRRRPREVVAVDRGARHRLPDVVERKTLLLELAQIRDAQSEPELAYLAFYRAFKEDPNDASCARSLEMAARRPPRRSWTSWHAAYEDELPRIAEPSDAAEGELHARAAARAAPGGCRSRPSIFYEKARELRSSVAQKALPALDRCTASSTTRQAGRGARGARRRTEGAAREGRRCYFRLGQLAMERLERSPIRPPARSRRCSAPTRATCPACVRSSSSTSTRR